MAVGSNFVAGLQSPLARLQRPVSLVGDLPAAIQLAAISLLAAFLRVLYLGKHSFWTDEIYSVSSAQLSWVELWHRLAGIEAGNMGAYYAEQQRALKAAEEERLELARKEAEDRAVEEAARLERNGQQEAADERLAAPVAPVVSTPAPQAPKAAGVSVKTKPNFRIVAESKIGREYLMVDKVKIGKVVRAMGVDAERLIGGIEVYEEPVVSARAAR